MVSRGWKSSPVVIIAANSPSPIEIMPLPTDPQITDAIKADDGTSSAVFSGGFR